MLAIKHLLASFRKKKNPEMSPTMAQHFRYSRCDPPHERFAIGVPFVFATSCSRWGHRRLHGPGGARRIGIDGAPEGHQRDCDCQSGGPKNHLVTHRIRLPPGNQKPCFKTLGDETQARPEPIVLDSDKVTRVDGERVRLFQNIVGDPKWSR